ncbi:hypothetical protein [Streptomyces sp. NBC_00019]|uniref:hypothetical protein n=1 Tax=Streptomyces sp. NBC_00019 TaxID=2975623 RepID=UPI00324E32CF
MTRPSLNIGPDEKEAGQLMWPGDRCAPSERPSTIRTYAQQRDFQQQQHRRAVLGRTTTDPEQAAALLANCTAVGIEGPV